VVAYESHNGAGTNMTHQARKTGRPRALEEESDAAHVEEPSLDDFLQEVHGISTVQQELPDSKIPSLSTLKGQFKTKSAVIRHLHDHYKLTVKQIAAHTGIRYQMVRNVLTNKLKRGPNEDFHLGEGQKASTVETDD
jgi:hypothetical protein